MQGRFDNHTTTADTPATVRRGEGNKWAGVGCSPCGKAFHRACLAKPEWCPACGAHFATLEKAAAAEQAAALRRAGRRTALVEVAGGAALVAVGVVVFVDEVVSAHEFRIGTVWRNVSMTLRHRDEKFRGDSPRLRPWSPRASGLAQVG